jgi:beta-glucosidase
MFRHLDDRVNMWGTINEPWVITDGGYLFGALAPGHRNRFETPIASHNLLRSHAMAVRAYRAEGRHRIGLVVNIEPKYPHSKRKADLDATRRADAYMNRQYLDPVYRGRYPDEMREIFGEAWPEWPASDLELIREKTDFLGVNYYTRSVVRHDPGNWLLHASRVKQKGALYTETDWEVFPRGFYDMLVWVKDRYGNPPVYVTENGAAFADPPKPSRGKLADPKRVAYYRSHLKALRDARAAGCDIRGYFAWSVLDNLEWSLGFSKRFGIVHVDFATQKRTPKDSAKFYSQVIATNGAILDEEPGRRR